MAGICSVDFAKAFAPSIMPDLADIADEIAATDAVQMQARSAMAFGAISLVPEAQGNRSVIKLGAEMLQVATLVAVVSSVFNALERHCFEQLNEHAVRAFLPAHSSAFVAAVTDITGDAYDLKRLLAFQPYLARFDFAVRLTSVALSTRDEGQARDSRNIDLIADAWRRTCVAALDAEALLPASCAETDDDRVVSVAAVRGLRLSARQLLAAAALGGWPCLDLDGRVTVPGWAERRRSPRLVVSQLVTVVVRGVASVGRLVDVSRSGMQIAAVATVSCGDAIEVVLADQRRARGQVRWTQAGRIGVQLNSPLDF